MDTPQPQSTPTTMPPTGPGSPVQKRSAWPVVIGVIAIVLGGFGVLLHSGSGLVSCQVNGPYSGTGQEMVNAAQAAATEQFGPWNLLSALGSLALAGLLLAAGIGMVRRRPWCGKASLAWSILKIVYSIPATVLAFIVNSAQIDAMQQASTEAGNSGAGGFFALAQGLGVGVIGCGLLWAWVFPVFVLIWFLRAKVRTEVATWAGQEGLEG